MAQSAQSVTILLVDDSPSDVIIAREALALTKVLNDVVVVTDGEAALDYLYRRGAYSNAVRPGIILLDLNLPRKSGREVLAELKSDENLKSIPVVILSTSKDPEDVDQMYKLNANCYITKPVDFDKFMSVVLSLQEFWINVVTLPSASK